MPVLFDHVALGLLKVTDAPPVLGGELGGVPLSGGPGPGYWGGQWEFANNARIETLEPYGKAGGFMHRFVESRGPGVHHVTFKVPNLREICDRAESLGYQIVGYNDADAYWKEAFLHPKQAQGIVVQFAETQTYDGSEDGWKTDWVEAPEASVQAAIVGLRLSTTAPERAKKQWGGVLQGTCTEADGTLVFRWPDSPMRITVDVDSAAPERPLAIEVSAEPDLGLPPEAYAALGTRFTQVW